MVTKLAVDHWPPGLSTKNMLLIVGLIISLINGVLSQGGAPVQYSIMEEEPGGTIVGDIATDAGISDIDPQMTFTITLPQGQNSDLEYFTLDTSSGRPLLLTIKSINREKICAQVTECNIHFNIMVQPIRFFQIIKVLVTIEDRNDNQPSFPQQSISTAISESAMPGTTFAVPSAEDLDSGANGIKTYEIRPEEGKVKFLICIPFKSFLLRSGTFCQLLALVTWIFKNIQPLKKIEYLGLLCYNMIHNPRWTKRD